MTIINVQRAGGSKSPIVGNVTTASRKVSVHNKKTKIKKEFPLDSLTATVKKGNLTSLFRPLRQGKLDYYFTMRGLFRLSQTKEGKQFIQLALEEDAFRDRMVKIAQDEADKKRTSKLSQLSIALTSKGIEVFTPSPDYKDTLREEVEKLEKKYPPGHDQHSYYLMVRDINHELLAKVEEQEKKTFKA